MLELFVGWVMLTLILYALLGWVGMVVSAIATIFGMFLWVAVDFSGREDLP